MLTNVGRFKFIFLGVLALLIALAIPLTISQLQRIQETRSGAAGEAVSVILDPQTKQITDGQILSVDVSVNAGQNNVSAVDITFTYDQNLLSAPIQIPEDPPKIFIPSTQFTTIKLETTTPGQIRYVGVNPSSNQITGTFKLGTFSFQTTNTGVATVGFSNIHINASGVLKALPVDTGNTKIGTYTIAAVSNTTASPTAANTPTPATSSASPTAANTPAPTAFTPTLSTCIDDSSCPSGFVCRSTQTESTIKLCMPQGTVLNLSLQLLGVGLSATPGLNSNPIRPQRNVVVDIYDSQNIKVLSAQGAVIFDPSTGLYKGPIQLPNLASGNYIVKVSMDNTLKRQIAGIQVITAAQVNNTQSTLFVTGDLNSDNEINLLDYNLMLACLAHVNNLCK